jgi:hypothetical protein
MAQKEFKHDLIVATEGGDVFRIPDGVWNDGKYKVNPREYEYDEGLDPEKDGSWQVLRELLQCGANVAVVPPVLPPNPDGTPKPQPRGTCYVLNLAGFKRSHRFHVKPT